MKKSLLAAAASVCLISWPTLAVAQTSFGTIDGAVKDATGAVVPGALVTITSRLTGETHTTTTKANGAFHFDSLGTGTYNATISASGFDRTVVESLQVNPSVTTSLNPVLQVGKVQDVVEVSGSNQVLQTESGEVSATINAKEINDLPVSSLNAYSLVQTLPGVTTVTTYNPTNSGGSSSFAANGARPRENNYLIEGQDNNDAGIAGQGLQPENEEAVQSVAFLLSSNSAEFGRGGGAISNLVYRSGTNQFHGAIWDRLLNSSLNAYNHSTTYNHGIKTKFRENIYGFRVGGPILKNKVFFFVSQQFDHYNATAAPGTLIVPTPSGYSALKAIRPTATLTNLLQAYGGLTASDDPTIFPSSYKKIPLGPDPVTGVDRGTATFGGTTRAVGTLTKSNELVAKGDYLFRDRDKLQLRFVRSPFTEPYDFGNFPNQLPLFDTDQSGTSYNAGIVEDHNFSPNLTNELRLSYGRIGFLFDLRPDTYSNPLLGPTVAISGIQGYGIPTNAPQGRFHDTYQIQDALTFARGSHTGKVGFDVAQVRVRDAVPFVFYGSISYVADSQDANNYSALANYIDDYSGYTTANSASLTKYFGNNIARPTLTNQAYYVQDHWKATSDLTMDVGFRYEYYGAPFNYIPFPAIDPTNIACFPCRTGVIPNFMNLGPRFGFAYSPGVHKDLVIRGGFGVFYDNTFTNVADNIQASTPNAATPIVYNGSYAASVQTRGTAKWSQQFSTLSSQVLPTNSATDVVNHFRNPRNYQYNLSVQHTLPGANSVTVTYAGYRGQHLYALDYLNPTIPGTSTRIVSSRGPIAVHDNTGDSEYNGLGVEFEHQYRANLLARLSYTYSKDLDDVSEEYTSGNYSAYPQIQLPYGSRRGTDWGPSAYDHRQRAVLSMVYSIPKWNASGFAKVGEAIVSGIQLSTITAYQSGSVGNLQTGIDINGDGITNDRPVLENKNAPFSSFAVRATDFYTAAKGGVPGQYCDGTYVANGLAKNPVTGANDQFCHPVALSSVHFYLGDRYTQSNTVSRNAFYFPGIIQDDVTAQKSFPLYKDKASMLFRAECFQCLNHGNTGIPNFTLYGTTDLPQAAGYTYSTQSFNNLAASVSGGRSLRFFLRAEF